MARNQFSDDTIRRACRVGLRRATDALDRDIAQEELRLKQLHAKRTDLLTAREALHAACSNAGMIVPESWRC